MKPSTLSGIVLSAAASAAAASLPTISAVGNKFFYENGTQFFIKGTESILPSPLPCSIAANTAKALLTSCLKTTR